MCKKKTFFLILCLVFSSCSQLEPGKRRRKLPRKKVARSLYNYLKWRNLQKASKYIVYLGKPRNNFESLLFSQFHLMNCNPRKSLEYISKNPLLEAKILKGVILGMVSIERKKRKLKHKLQGRDLRSLKSYEQLSYPIDSFEVWPDEWDFIRSSKGECKDFPIAHLDNQNLLMTESKKIFAEIPEEVILKNFPLFSLALDLNYNFTNLDKSLENFKQHQSNSYYQYVKKKLIEKDSSTVKESGIQEDGTIDLTILDIENTTLEAKKIKIPFVLGEHFL